MPITIGANISSLRTQRQLGKTTDDLARVYERLSSGQRINRASDDAAGLAISETLNAKAKIFTQGVRNLNDGISFTSIAGGALKELKTILFRQRELATQSSNGTYSDTQRGALEGEFKALTSEWNRVLESTTFNGRGVFSASNGSLTLQAGIGSDSVLHAGFGSAEAAAQDDIRRASTSAQGVQGNLSSSQGVSISADGRYVTFNSTANNLVTGDTNGVDDVFVKDLQSGAITQVTGEGGAQGNAGSGSGGISADGRYVTFSSAATNLVSGDTNGVLDVFVKDLQSGAITQITGEGGVQGNGASSGAGYATISADGRYAVFTSTATNLVSGDTNGFADIFVKDLRSGAISRITGEGGAQGDADISQASISADGRYVVFRSTATNLVSGDTNGVADTFVKDLQSGGITRVTGEGGAQGNAASSFFPSISANGRYVAFTSSASNLVSGDTNGTADIFVKDMQSGGITQITGEGGAQGDGSGSRPSISADGRYVAFISSSTNLVSGDTNGNQDIFVKDLQSGGITRIAGVGNTQPDSSSLDPKISADGRFVAFTSVATNLVSGDTNGVADIFFAGNSLLDWSTVSRNQWLSVATRDDALLAQDGLDQYLTELNTIEGSIGAIDVRLGTAISNLQSMAENFRAAESRIKDADIGQETASLTRAQIIQQAAASVLSQANLQPQIALSLLR